MLRVWAQPLRRQLFIAIVLLLVPVLAAAVWSGLVTFRERTDELRNQTRVVAITTAAYLNRDLANLNRVVEGLSKSPAVQAMDPRAVTDLFSRVAVGRPSIASMLLIDSMGSEVTRVEVSDEVPPGGLHWGRELLKTGQRVVSPLQPHEGGGADYMVMAYPVRNGTSQLLGALSLFMNVPTLQEAFASLPLPAGSVVTIADADGRI